MEIRDLGSIWQYEEIFGSIRNMLIPPTYFLTPKISALLQSIEASREVIHAIQIPPENERTLRYDLKRLADQGLIRKRGTTKGAHYEPTKI